MLQQMGGVIETDVAGLYDTPVGLVISIQSGKKLIPVVRDSGLMDQIRRE
jgi:hypothetical protein